MLHKLRRNPSLRLRRTEKTLGPEIHMQRMRIRRRIHDLPERRGKDTTHKTNKKMENKNQGAVDEKRDEKMKIKLIKNGVVIDHITAGRSLEVLRILNIDGADYEDEVTIGMNIPSRSMGKKDIVKLENRDVKTDEINKIAVIAPCATINRIRDYRVVKKEKVTLPNEIIGIVRCPNPQCISNKAREPVKSFLRVVQREPLVLACKYCEREVKNL